MTDETKPIVIDERFKCAKCGCAASQDIRFAAHDLSGEGNHLPPTSVKLCYRCIPSLTFTELLDYHKEECESV